MIFNLWSQLDTQVLFILLDYMKCSCCCFFFQLVNVKCMETKVEVCLMVLPPTALCGSKDGIKNSDVTGTFLLGMIRPKGEKTIGY